MVDAPGRAVARDEEQGPLGGDVDLCCLGHLRAALDYGCSM